MHPSPLFCYSAYPNPAMDNILFRFKVPSIIISQSRCLVTLQIIDSYNTVVKTLINEDMYPGHRYRVWDLNDDNGNRVPPGMYRALITAGDYAKQGDIKIVAE